MLLEFAAAARDRVNNARAGKRLLDEGGEPAEAALTAKLAAEEAASLDSFIAHSVPSLICAYDDTAGGLRAAMLNPQVPGIEAVDLARISEAHRSRAQLYRAVSSLIAEPLGKALPLSPTEQNAASLLQMRHMRLRARQSLGLQFRQARPTLLHGRGRPSGDTCCCCDDESPGAAPSRGPRTSTRAPSKLSPQARLSLEVPRGQRLEELISELFRMHDLNGNGVLEEKELVKLNEKIAAVHHGDGVDKAAVKAKFRSLFREKLDPQGLPVSPDVFRKYILQLLGELDSHEDAQEMIAEQFIAEALTARATFHSQNVDTPEDAQRLALLKVPSFSTISTEVAPPDVGTGSIHTESASTDVEPT